MVKIVEAAAVISARAGDMSGIDKLAEKIAATGKAGAMVKNSLGAASADLGKQVEAIGSKLAKVDNFRTVARGLDETSLAMRRTQQEAARLKREIDSTASPTKAMMGEYSRASMAVTRATAAFREQGQVMKAATRDLLDAGIVPKQLARHQAELTRNLTATTAAMKQQIAIGRSAATHPWGAPVQRHSGSGVPLIQRVPPGTPTIPAPAAPRPGLGIGMGGLATVGGAVGAKSAYDRALEFEKSVNAAQARGELSKEEADGLRRNARQLGAQGLGFKAKDVMELQRAYVQAGFEKQAGGLALPTMQFSAFGDVDPYKAADFTVSALSAYGVRPGDKSAVGAAQRYQDIVAKGANITRLGVEDFAQGFKFAAPLASRLGVSQEQLAAMIASMGQSGLRGDESGVAIRSMLVRAVRPTQDARQVMAEMGMRWEDYATSTKPVRFDDYASGLRNQGFNISGKRKEIEAQVAAATKEGGDPAVAIAEAVIKEMNVTGVKDRQKIAKMTAKYASSLGEGLDIDRLLKDLEAKGVTTGQIARLFDVKQGARLANVLGPQYEEFLKVLQQASQGASARGAAVMNQGAVGAHNRLTSSYDNLILSLAESGVLDAVSSGLDGLATVMRKLGDASPATLQFVTYSGLFVAAMPALAAAMRVASVSIAGANAALGVGGAAAGAVAGAAGTAGAAGAIRAGAVLASRAAPPAMLGYGLYDLLSGGYEPVKGDRDQVAPGEAHNFSQKRRRAYHDALRAETQAVRSQYGTSLDDAGVMPLGAPAAGRVMMMPGAGASDTSGAVRMPTWAAREAEATRRTDVQRVQSWEDALPKAGGAGTVEAVVKPDQVTAKADVSVQGQAQVTVTLAPTGAFAGLIQAAQAAANAPLSGNGPGSTGRSMPEAAPTGGGGGGGAM
ncbi:phage tail tape measure protein [Bosea vestrisii]|uniref:phage tail tape measure protein n=1 Tax=Bosea vestrisii TaxID=151416 RepID=UPI00366AD097